MTDTPVSQQHLRIFVRDTRSRHNDVTAHIATEADAAGAAGQPTSGQVAAADPRDDDTHVNAGRLVAGLETSAAAASDQLLSPSQQSIPLFVV